LAYAIEKAFIKGHIDQFLRLCQPERTTFQQETQAALSDMHDCCNRTFTFVVLTISTNTKSNKTAIKIDTQIRKKHHI